MSAALQRVRDPASSVRTTLVDTLLHEQDRCACQQPRRLPTGPPAPPQRAEVERSCVAARARTNGGDGAPTNLAPKQRAHEHRLEAGSQFLRLDDSKVASYPRRLKGRDKGLRGGDTTVHFRPNQRAHEHRLDAGSESPH